MNEPSRSFPAAGDADMTLGLLREGYDYVGNRCERLGSDLFRTRLLARPAICMRGAEAAELFYDESRFTRQGAMPKPALRLLQDEGSVATLEGEAHRRRKAMFLELMGESERERLREIFATGWRARLCRPEPRAEVILHDEVQRILCECAFAWCGIDLPEERVPEATRRLSEMIEGAGGIGSRHWRARLDRRREERALAARVTKLRSEGEPGKRDPLHVVAFHAEDGHRLDPEVAAVELLNLLRPIVAISRYISFAAHALAEHSDEAEACRTGGAGAVERFAREVRRFYPFFPIIAARVRYSFSWHGFQFPEGRRVLLDIYGTNRHPDLWPEPDRFDPSRHEGRSPTPFDLIPQGGGDHWTGHRCAGEWMTVHLLEETVRLLSREMHYEVPPESLRIDRSVPALPRNGFTVRNVRAA